jgi:glycosyltransferase involved in cell wall biosynthesis
LIEELGLRDSIKHYGNVEEKDIPVHYQAADLAVFPSYYEGFGMPVLEAMSSGCPVLASNATSIPEVTGDSAVLFDPHDIEDLKSNANKILSSHNMLKELEEKGIERAKELTWEKTAQLTEELYDNIIDEKHSS